MTESEYVRLLRHNIAVQEWFWTIADIKQALRDDDIEAAAEVWWPLPNEVKMQLWVAPRSGGIFTTSERAMIKSTEFREAYSFE